MEKTNLSRFITKESAYTLSVKNPPIGREILLQPLDLPQMGWRTADDSGKGMLSCEPSGPIDLFDFETISCLMQRKQLEAFLAIIPSELHLRCSRYVYKGVCNASNAEGLYEEKMWCELAMQSDPVKDPLRRGYIVKVTHTNLFFALFNFRIQPEFSDVKLSQTLAVWPSQIAVLMNTHHLKELVFLEKETLDLFTDSTPFSKIYRLFKFPFCSYNG